MLTFLLNALKIIVMLGFLVFIHEGGHFLVAKLFKVKVNEFALGFGPTIFTKEKGGTKYALRLIPLGGFVSMEGEEERSDKEGSFSNASVPKRILIVMAGAIVNIIFGLLAYFLLISFATDFSNTTIENNLLSKLNYGLANTKNFILAILDNLKQLFTGKVGANQMVGIVGISDIVVNTNGFFEYLYIVALISLSLGITNLLPLPPLDGGKILIYIIELIRRKPMKEETELKIQTWGFSILIALSIYVTCNDIIRIF